ncbi:hypothetical protein OC861_006832 [Tilletia horrida]|nr:hypothetical protein OC861_006832 [Tilletia horrida]
MSQPPAVLTGESEPAEWKTQSAVEPIDEDDPFDPTAASAPPDSARAELPEPAASSSSAAALSPAGPIQGESDGAAVSQQAGSQQLPTASSGPLSLDDLLALTESCGKNLNLLQMSLRPSLQRAVRAARILDGAEDVLLDFSSQGQDPLNLLDPATHSLMLLFLITARSRAIRHADQLAAMIQLLEVFIARADIAQLLLSPDRVTMLAQAIVHVGELAKDPAWALNVLTVLFHRYVGEARLLTALHPIVLAQCIKAGAYDAALRTALRYPVEDVDPMFSPVRFPDVLQYFYYAGIVAAKLEHYPSAIDYFEQCVTTPAQSTSPIQTDAFKKLVLIQLLHDGKTPVLPEYTSAAVSRTLATSCRTYLSFAKLFEDRHATDAEVYHKAEEVKDVFQKDQNWPLAQQVLNTYRSRRIQRLSATYSCITLVEIAHLLGMSDTVETIQSIHEEVGRMIAAGWIDGSLSFANIPQSPTPVPILYFYSANPSSTPSGSGGSKFADIPSITHIQAQLLEAQALKAEVEDRERKMARSAAFLQKQMSSNGGYSGGGQRAGGAGGSSVDSSGFGISGAGGASIGAGGRVTDAYGMPVDDEELDDDTAAVASDSALCLQLQVGCSPLQTEL